MDLDKNTLVKNRKAALKRVHDLESELVEANATELYWRRAVRKHIIGELAAENGAAPGQVDANTGDDDDDDEKPLADLVPDRRRKAAPPPSPLDTVAPKKRMKRPEHGVDACIACWAAERQVTAGRAHLYRPPCLRVAPSRGKWAKKAPGSETQTGDGEKEDGAKEKEKETGTDDGAKEKEKETGTDDGVKENGPKSADSGSD